MAGDKDSQIHFEGYQVSNQCMSLVRDSCLVPTYDAPDLAYVKESSSAQYVPDVFYKEMDKYGNEVTSVARPLPVEYAIVDVPASMPKEPHYTFRSTQVVKGKQSFPVENRLDQLQVALSPLNRLPPVFCFNRIGNVCRQLIHGRVVILQDMNTLMKYVSQFSQVQLVDAMSDFHVLVFMAAMENVTLQVCSLDHYLFPPKVH